MHSRRSVLRAAGAALAGGTAGCASLAPGVEGYVQLKSIDGVSQTQGRLVSETVLRVVVDPDAGAPEVTHLGDGWRGRVETPRTPVVTDALHADLTRAFDRVRYVVGVTSPGWADEGESVGSYNVATTRENFDRVQVPDRVRASSDGTYLRLHAVDGAWTFDPR